MIRSCILQIYSSHDSRPGTYKIQKLLASEFCIHISAGRVYRLMKDMKLPSFRAKKPCFVYADLSFEAQNLLKQNFTQKAPDLVWCSDITYLKVQNKFYYLCVIINLFSRKIVAYRLSSKIDAKLVTDTFLDAYVKRKYPKGLMFHSDRGSQYTSETFRKVLDNCGVVQSFSAKGHPYDNAVAECFFKYLKKEETDRRYYKTFKDLRLSVFQYIDGYYNSRRPHSSLDYMTPLAFEKKYYDALV